MQLQAPFNAQAFDPTQGGNFQQLPTGKHPVIITASEVKATKDGSGGMVVLELEVIDGPNKGAVGNMIINLYSSSDKARSVAESQFAALGYVTGVFMITDTAQLHGKPFAVDVQEQSLTAEQQAKKAAGETVTPFTQVKKILDMNGQEPKANGTASAAPANAPAPAAWGGGATPAQQQPAAGGWGGGQQAAAALPTPAATQTPAAGGWQQNAAGAAQPAWGKR